MRRPRRCVCYPVCVPDVPQAALALERVLNASVSSLRYSNQSIPVLVLWFARDEARAQAIRKGLEGCFANCAFLPMGSYFSFLSEFTDGTEGEGEDEADRELEHMAASGTLCALTALWALACLTLDQLLVVDLGVGFPGDVAALFASHRCHDVVAHDFPAAASALPPAAHDQHPKPCRGPPAPVPLQPYVLYNSQAWLKLLPWLPEALTVRARGLQDGLAFAEILRKAAVSLGSFGAGCLAGGLRRKPAGPRLDQAEEVVDVPLAGDVAFASGHPSSEEVLSDEELAPVPPPPGQSLAMQAFAARLLQVPAPILQRLGM